MQRSLRLLDGTGAWRVSCTDAAQKVKMKIFVSRYAPCLMDLRLRRDAGELGARVPPVVPNHPDLRTPRAEPYAVPFQHPAAEETETVRGWWCSTCSPSTR